MTRHMFIGSRAHDREAVAKTGSVMLAAAILSAFSLLAFSATGSSAAAAPADTSMTLTRIAPVSVQPGKTLHITGRFTSDRELTGVTVQLEIGSVHFNSRSEVTEAAANPPLTDPVTGAVDKLDKVRAGATREFRIVVPGGKLPLASTQAEAGVYPMRIVVTDGPNATLLEQVTTFLPWVPDRDSPKASRLLFFWPLIDVPRRDATGAFTVPGLDAELGPKGRLQTLMSAGRTAPITWMIDPSLLTDVTALADGGTADAGRARQWLDSFPAAVGSSDVTIVPYGDPDLAAVAASDRIDVLRLAMERGEAVIETILLGKDVRTDLGWPADGAADDLTIDRVQRAGADMLLLAEPTAPLVTPETYTPSGRFGQTDTAPELLLADSPASALVASPAQSVNDVVLSQQRFLAETLLHSLELPNNPRLMVIAPPRRWDPNPRWAQALVQATLHASWLNPVSVDEALRPSAPVVEREPPTIPEASAERQLPSELVVRAADALPRARKFRAILHHPGELARPIEEALLTSFSTAWRSDHEAGFASQTATIERLDTQSGKVRIVSQGGTLTDDRGLLPITVRNQLDQAVDVRLSVESVDPLRLRAQAPDDTMRIAAQSGKTVNIQLDAVTSGRLGLNVQLLTPHGHPYSDPVELTVDVRAYGHVALMVFGAAVALMVLAATVRLFRRFRSAHRTRA